MSVEAKAKGIVTKKIAGRPLILWVAVGGAAYLLYSHFHGTTTAATDPTQQLAPSTGSTVTGSGAPSDTGQPSGQTSDANVGLNAQYANVSSSLLDALFASQSDNAVFANAFAQFASQSPNPGLSSTTDSHNTTVTNNYTSQTPTSASKSTTSAAPPQIPNLPTALSRAEEANQASPSQVSAAAAALAATTARINAEASHTSNAGAAQKASAEKSKEQKKIVSGYDQNSGANIHQAPAVIGGGAYGPNAHNNLR